MKGEKKMSKTNETTSLKNRISQNVATSLTEIIVESLANVLIFIEKSGKGVKSFLSLFTNSANDTNKKKPVTKN